MLFRLASVGVLAVVLATQGAPAADPPRLPQAIAKLLRSQTDDVSCSLWVGRESGSAVVEFRGDEVMPTASAVKTFYLVELFAAEAERLDQPLPDAMRILNDDAHPAISHFARPVREEIRRELGGTTVRRVGEIMMGKTDVSNAVYNAAANLVTGHLGGPEQLTKLIHRRDPRFASVMVRRYMLRDRKQPGDNEATAAAFAALYQSLASRTLKGITPEVMTALHHVLKQSQASPRGTFHEKDGGLSTDPLTAVKSGWVATRSGPVVFVVMCRKTTADEGNRNRIYEDLQSLALSLRDRLVDESASMR